MDNLFDIAAVFCLFAFGGLLLSLALYLWKD